MIYVDMKCFSMRKCFDIKFDETMSVDELIDRVSNTFQMDGSATQIVSVNKRGILCKQKSFSEQGIKGGDTLIIVECDKGN